jgi:SAM-dependent methyltransferase
MNKTNQLIIHLKKIIIFFIPKLIYSKYKAIRKRKYKEMLIKGDRVYCPICKSKFSFFADFGLIVRKNALCHKCGSLERHRLLFLYLESLHLKVYKDSSNYSLLHFAPEKGLFQFFINKSNINYIPCDLNPSIFSFDKTKLIKKIDITNIDLKSNSINLVLCSHVLEHIPDDKLAMKEIYRILKTNGFAIIQVPIDYSIDDTFEDWSIIDPIERERVFGQNDHVRIYGNNFRFKLSEVGFEVEEFDFSSKFYFEDIKKFGLDNSGNLFVCKKLNL